MNQLPENEQPSWRKPAGIGLILLIIAGWAVLVVSVMGWIGPLPAVITLIVYAIAGIVWILPLRPILIWMETGRWR